MDTIEQSKPVKIITPNPPTISEYWREMVQYRGLIVAFAQQEVKAMYAQTYFGLLWSIFRPLITVAIFSIIFNYFLKVPTDKPYYIFAFAGMIAWNFFSQVVNNASGAIVSKANLIRKMYFPKLILPLYKVMVAGVDLVVSLCIIFAMMFYEGGMLGWHTLSLPLFVILNVLCGLAVALWMNSLNIHFRDLHQIIPAIIGIAIWVTPVFYPTTIIPAGYDFFVYANPMAGVIKGFRFALLGEAFPEWQYWIAMGITSLLAIVGAWYLSQTEDKMVDYA
jgi:lipopolysaccharide transport system permease protein